MIYGLSLTELIESSRYLASYWHDDRYVTPEQRAAGLRLLDSVVPEWRDVLSAEAAQAARIMAGLVAGRAESDGLDLGSAIWGIVMYEEGLRYDEECGDWEK